MAELLIIAYLVAWMFTARAALQSLVEYMGDSDTLDMFLFGIVAILAGMVWPILLAGGALVYWVRWTALKGRHDA